MKKDSKIIKITLHQSYLITKPYSEKTKTPNTIIFEETLILFYLQFFFQNLYSLSIVAYRKFLIIFVIFEVTLLKVTSSCQMNKTEYSIAEQIVDECNKKKQ